MACQPYIWTDNRRPELEEALRTSRTRQDAARGLGISLTSLDAACRRWAIKPSTLLGTKARHKDEAPEVRLKRALDETRRELDRERARVLTEDEIRKVIIGARENLPEPPAWLTDAKGARKGPGVPVIAAADWHWDEVVDPETIGGVNSYNREIATRRARAFVQNTIDVLTAHMVKPEYPGVVLCLAGDMVSGDIHDELSVSNEEPIMASVLDVYGVLAWVVEQFAEKFKRVFVPCVTGNHSRITNKPRAKGRAHTSFDWLLYSFLAKRFEGDPRVQFQVPLNTDAQFQVYGHRFLLTHGDQFRGGDGLIGVLGPVARGDHKKRSRNAQIGQGFDTMILGHFHQHLMTRRFILVPSLKGYDEYAHGQNLPFEPPAQALWIVHPTHGITFHAPIFVESQRPKATAGEWVSWAA